VINIDPELYRSQNVEPRDKKIVVVKSATAFRNEYAPFAAAMLLVDTPGISSANLRSVPYRRLERPIYPLDDFDSPWA
jgi:microcystin degradation protein MlrC